MGKKDTDRVIPVVIQTDDVITRAFKTMVGCILGLVLLDISVNRYQWATSPLLRGFANITREDSLANWFSVIQILITAVVLWVIVLTVKRTTPQKAVHRGWTMIAVFFTYLGVDDATLLHERVGLAFKTGFSIDFFPTYTWHLVFGPLFAFMGLFIFTFLWRELKTFELRRNLVVALGFYVIAVGLDFIEGLGHDPYKDLADVLSVSSGPTQHYQKLTEECLEMLGTTFFFVTYLRYAFSLASGYKIALE